MLNFLYRFEFIRYAAAHEMFSRKKLGYWGTLIAFYVLLIVGLVMAILSYNVVVFIVTALGSILFVAGGLAGIYRAATPNLCSLMPLSYKKRCVYDFLAVILFSLVIFAIICATFLVVGIISGIFSLITKSAAEEEVVEELDVFVNSIGVNGGLFCAAYCVICYCGGIISGYIKRRKTFSAVFVVALLLGIMFTQIPYTLAYPEGFDVGTTHVGSVVSPFVQVCYDKMALPWLSSVLWFIVAAVLFGAAVYISIHHNKPKKY